MKSFLVAFFLSLFFFILASWDLYSPYYAFIGDEYSFFNMAKEIINGYRPSFFSQRGVYGYHPTLDSYYQALIMHFFGVNIYGWKISAVVLVSVSIIFFYYFLRNNFNSLVALFGSFLLATSHYILAMVHTGYNNIHSLFPLILGLFFASKAKRNLLFAFLAGLVSGLGFYTFYTARVTLLIIFFIFLNDIKAIF